MSGCSSNSRRGLLRNKTTGCHTIIPIPKETKGKRKISNKQIESVYVSLAALRIITVYDTRTKKRSRQCVSVVVNQTGSLTCLRTLPPEEPLLVTVVPSALVRFRRVTYPIRMADIVDGNGDHEPPQMQASKNPARFARPRNKFAHEHHHQETSPVAAANGFHRLFPPPQNKRKAGNVGANTAERNRLTRPESC